MSVAVDVAQMERLRRLRALRQAAIDTPLYVKVCERIVAVECGPPSPFGGVFTLMPCETPRCGRHKPRLPTEDDDWAFQNGGGRGGYR